MIPLTRKTPRAPRAPKTPSAPRAPKTTTPTGDGEYKIPDLRLGVRDAKTNLSWALREVKQGKEVVITEYGKPIARLVPARALSLEERLAEMESRGEIEPASRPSRKLVLPLMIPGDLAQKLLEEGRE